MRVALAVPILLALLASPASAETLTVESGGLTAIVETDPWSLRFVDADGDEIVAESPGMRIGFRTSMGWAGATRATSATPWHGRRR